VPEVRPDDLELEVSGFDDFAGPITDAYFDIIAEYAEKAGSDIVHLICEVAAEGFQKPPKLGGFSCGGADKWDIAKDGKELLPKKGKPRFHANSNAGVFVSDILKMAGDGDIKKGAEVLAKRGFLMTQAGFYIGLESRWVKRASPNPVDKSSTVSIQVPTEYLILGDSKTIATKTVPTAVDEGFEISDEELGKIQEIAEGKTERELRQACIKVPELKLNTALMSQIYNKGLLKKLENEGRLTLGPNEKYV